MSTLQNAFRRLMKPRQIKSASILATFFILFFVCSCNDSDPAKTRISDKNMPRLFGTWQQVAIGDETVSNIVVKLIFSENTLTMDAPGCLIIGDYTTAGNTFTYTVTSAQGERCASGQTRGRTDTVNYEVTDSQLILTSLLAGKKQQSTYERIND